jgi:hypothetical protein
MTSPKLRYLTVILILLTAILACDFTSTGSGIRDYGAAEEIHGNYWFHVRKPLTMEVLNGKVVLVSVWRFT